MTATPSDATAHQHGNGSLTPAAEPATGFDADNLTAADELAIDIGRVAIEASEGVPYGSEPDEFFLAAGKAVFSSKFVLRKVEQYMVFHEVFLFN